MMRLWDMFEVFQDPIESFCRILKSNLTAKIRNDEKIPLNYIERQSFPQKTIIYLFLDFTRINGKFRPF